MKIAIGSDHRGVAAKSKVISVLRQLGHEVLDLGPESASSVDYPDYAIPVAEAVSSGRVERGILICGTGIGMCIAANKVSGVRAALCTDAETARGARRWNDANVLALGLRLTSPIVAREMLEAFLGTEPDPDERETIARVS